MAKLIMMRGLPRSGKSTWAREFLAKSGNAVIVSRDFLRDMLHNNKWSHRNEKLTMSAQKVLVEHLLKTTQTVIVDDTNLGKHHEDRWAGVAKEAGASFEIHHEKEGNLLTLIQRDTQALVQRGPHVIISMAMANGYVHFPDGDVVICDLDGTLADIMHRRHFVQGVCSDCSGNSKDGDNCPALGTHDKKDWDSFFRGVPDDTLREDVADILEGYQMQGKTIIFVSGRPERCRKDTEEWLANNGFALEHNVAIGWGGKSYFALLMRQDADSRPDTEVKQDILDRLLKKSWIHKVIDDRPSVIRMWEANGLSVLDVGDGIEF